MTLAGKYPSGHLLPHFAYKDHAKDDEKNRRNALSRKDYRKCQLLY